MMYYIYTADKLTRTSTWLEGLEGGLGHLQEVVIDDKLDLCNELEDRMQHLVDTYRCEWKAVVEDPEKRKLYRQFVNTDDNEPYIEFIDERGQHRPANWPKDGELVQLQLPEEKISTNGKVKRPEAPKPQWIEAGKVSDFPSDGGAAIKYGDVQIAVFNFTSRGEWYACQNMCPHKNAFVLSRGILGSAGDTPKVACPLHKKPFSLESGESLSGEEFSVKVFPVKVEGESVFVEVPPSSQLDALLATKLHIIGQESSQSCTACTSQEAVKV